jgi:hypothetical protein
MRLPVQVIVEADDGSLPAVDDVAQVERDDLRVETLGLHLTEAKDLPVQHRSGSLSLGIHLRWGLPTLCGAWSVRGAELRSCRLGRHSLS